MPVNTVTGQISEEQLGRVLMHEHLLFSFPGFDGDITLGPFDHGAAVENSIKMAEQLKSYGVQSVVEATPNDCGRNPEFLKEVADKTGLNIICSTGYYYEGEGAPAYFKFRSALGDIEKEIYDMFMTEITEGIAKTGIKPGVFKLASSKDVITDYEQTFFRAAAKAQQETGIPIITHTQEGTMGPEQAEFLVSAGVNPEKIMIGHIEGNTNIDYLIKTIYYGVSIGFDRCGLQILGMPMDPERIKVLADLIVTKGNADNIMISSDNVWNWLGRPLSLNDELAEILAPWSPLNIFETILPALEEKGVSKDQIETMLVENPRKLFA